MPLKIANVYHINTSDAAKMSIANAINAFVQKPHEPQTPEQMIAKLSADLQPSAPNDTFSYSFHVYQPVSPAEDEAIEGMTTQEPAVFIDVSINDPYSFLQHQKLEMQVEFNDDVKELLAKYKELNQAYKGKLSWDKGYFVSEESEELKKMETETLPELVDENFTDIQAVAVCGANLIEMTDAVFLLGYAVKKESEAIETLFQRLLGHDHTIHNMAARSLFPKAATGKCDFLSRAKDLLNHHNSYCINKYLGAASTLNWTESHAQFFLSIKPKLDLLAKNPQPAVFLPAKSILSRFTVNTENA